MTTLTNSNSLGKPGVIDIGMPTQTELSGVENTPAETRPLTKDLLLLARDNFLAQLDQKWTVATNSAAGATEDEFNDIAKLSKKICMSLHSGMSDA
jgi:hypothetical protein